MDNDVSNESLYHAVVDNNVGLLNDLLENGGDVDAFYEDTTNISSKSLLHVCCGKGLTECLRVMIRHGAQLDVRDKWGQTPLMHSVIIQYPEIVEILLAANQDLVNCQDKFGKSSLQCAVEAGNLDLVQIIIQNNADVNVRNHDGYTPLMVCCKYVKAPHLIILKELLNSGSLVDLEDYRGRLTALHIAVTSKNVEAVALLIAAGSDVNIIDKTLRNPLTHAIFLSRGNDDSIIDSIVALLVSAGACLNVTTTETCNPLLVCAQVRSTKLMKFVLASGADPNVKFPSGLTPALVSALANDLESLQVLIQHNSDLTVQGRVYKRRRREEFVLDPFQMALLEGHLDACILMVLSGYPLNRKWHTEQSRKCLGIAFPEFDSDADTVDCDNLMLPSSPCENREKLGWIMAISSQCQTLKNLCVFAIRASLDQNVVERVSHLPLPLLVKDAISFKHILHVLNG